MPQSRTLYIGLDVHKASITVASVTQDQRAAVSSLGTIGTRQGALEPLLRTRPSKANHLRFGDEAGPWGDWLSRDLTNTGDPCGGVAPAPLPNKAGDRINPDRRDAVPLARRLRSGDLTAVSVPTVDEDARRARTRAREETLADLKAAQCRLKALLRRPALR